MEGDKKILVFYNPDWKIHWEIIANWRDDFNESGLFNKGYRLIFINVKSDIVQWELAYINLYIEDLPQYLNRLNDPVINNFFDVDLKHPYPMTYLIDANGIVLDKYKRDILDYFHY
ncbi:MAG: hypothetical protein R2753_12925 [Chitinophagales bacterium]